jgi:hypothetical protein
MALLRMSPSLALEVQPDTNVHCIRQCILVRLNFVQCVYYTYFNPCTVPIPEKISSFILGQADELS